MDNGAIDRRHYLEIVYRLGSNSCGLFGAKLMWNNVRWAVEKFQQISLFSGLDRIAVFRKAFPDLRVIHVTRRDRARQAVSWAIAAQDGVWVMSSDEPAVPSKVPEYSFDFIANLENLIVEGETGWHNLFEELEITPCEVIYEDFADEGLEPTIRSILGHLGIESDIDVPRPRATRQADELNRAWLERYSRDRQRYQR